MAKTSVSKPATTVETPAANNAKPAAKKAPKTVAKPKAPKLPAAVPSEAPAAATPAVRKEEPAKTRPEARDEPEAKARKPKLVRDSFTMPDTEYAALGEIKKACLKAGIEAKKSELLRAGVALLKRLDTDSIREVLATLPSLKAGRPKKGK